jgi:hypothetical protein
MSKRAMCCQSIAPPRTCPSSRACYLVKSLSFHALRLPLSAWQLRGCFAALHHQQNSSTPPTLKKHGACVSVWWTVVLQLQNDKFDCAKSILPIVNGSTCHPLIVFLPPLLLPLSSSAPAPPSWAPRCGTSPVARCATAPTICATLNVPRQRSRTGSAEGRCGPETTTALRQWCDPPYNSGVAPPQPPAQHPCGPWRDTPAAGGVAWPGLQFATPNLLHLHIGQVAWWSILPGHGHGAPS